MKWSAHIEHVCRVIYCTKYPPYMTCGTNLSHLPTTQKHTPFYKLHSAILPYHSSSVQGMVGIWTWPSFLRQESARKEPPTAIPPTKSSVGQRGLLFIDHIRSACRIVTTPCEHRNPRVMSVQNRFRQNEYVVPGIKYAHRAYYRVMMLALRCREGCFRSTKHYRSTVL